MEHEATLRILVSDRARLLAYVWSIVRDEHAAEDLYQELIVVAMGRVKSFDDSIHLLKWSRLTLRNKALEHLRRQRNTPVPLAGDVLDLLEGHWNEYDSLDSAEMTEALRRCLSLLTSKTRRLVELRYGQGLRGTDVARVTDRKPHTIYVALSRAYKTLGDCIGRRISEEQPHA
ncbi:sigma-70 family RNA polymerase sigma factor [Planctomycetaceae bacterium SH139]